ncbi:hypothetical protein [Streptomyces sp. NPDC015125]|uniref:hypothetical protein n=1 Tax=Streptomyces sp. NPDC015125 TaxID=3364938 RepID=UPI0036FB19FD
MSRMRAAVPEDAAGPIRLRRLMFLAMNGRDAPGNWERDAQMAAHRQPTGPQARPAGFVMAGDVGLHATDDAEPLYRRLGFTEHPTALSLDLPSGAFVP